MRVKNQPALQETQEMQVRSLDREEFPGEGNANPLQYSCLKNPMDRGAWLTTVQRITESDTTQQQTHNEDREHFNCPSMNI